MFCPYLMDFRDKPAREKTEEKYCKFFPRCEEEVCHAENNRKAGSMGNLWLRYVDTRSSASNCVSEI